jgi:PilZ domain
VRSPIGEVTGSIGGLREILVRVVRTSTADANRRGAPRYPTDARAEVLDVAGQMRAVALLDVSETGAKIRCGADVRLGKTGKLKLEGVTSALPFVVRARQPDCIHVEFELPDELAKLYRQWLGTRFDTVRAKARERAVDGPRRRSEPAAIIQGD